MKNKKLFLVLIFLLIIILGVYFAYSKSKNKLSSLSSKNPAAAVVSLKNQDSQNDFLNNVKCNLSQYYISGKCYGANQVVSNSKNPYDTVGMQHNAGLDYVLTRIPINASKKQLGDVLAEYYKLNGFNIDTNLVLSDSFFSKINGNAPLGVSVNIQKYVDKVKAINPESTTVEIYNQIILLEDQILSDKNLSVSEKETLLSCMSIARYSNFYLEKNKSIFNSNNGVSLFRWHWSIFRADVFGGYVGAVIGGPVGAGFGAIAASTIALDAIEKEAS